MTARHRTRTRWSGVYRLSSGRYEITFKDASGLIVSAAVADTLEEARIIRAACISDLQSGAAPLELPTFGAFANMVVDNLDAPSNSVETYRYRLTHYLLPEFGNTRLDLVDLDSVDRLVAGMKRPTPRRRAGYTRTTIDNALATLSFVMNHAVNAGYAVANPVHVLDRTTLPNASPTERRFVTRAEVQRLLESAEETVRPVIATMLLTGLRLSEVLRLRWEDIDQERGVIGPAELTNARELVIGRVGTPCRGAVLSPDVDALPLELPPRAGARPEDLVFTAPDGTALGYRTTKRNIGHAIKHAELGDIINANGVGEVRIVESSVTGGT